MPSAKFQAVLDAWCDEALSQPIAADVRAFCFNLAEPWCIEVVGSKRYSDADPDWPCEEAFRPTIDNFDLPESEVGSSWETVLESAKKIVSAYLARPGSGSARLKKAEAVAVGFVDGDLHRVWPK